MTPATKFSRKDGMEDGQSGDAAGHRKKNDDDLLKRGLRGEVSTYCKTLCRRRAFVLILRLCPLADKGSLLCYGHRVAMKAARR